MDAVALRRVALFLAVGGFGVFVNLGAFAAARSAVGETAASVVGAAAGVLSNFALHVRLTFRDRVAGAGGLAAWARLFGEFCASSAVARQTTVLDYLGTRLGTNTLCTAGPPFKSL